MDVNRLMMIIMFIITDESNLIQAFKNETKYRETYTILIIHRVLEPDLDINKVEEKFRKA